MVETVTFDSHLSVNITLQFSMNEYSIKLVEKSKEIIKNITYNILLKGALLRDSWMFFVNILNEKLQAVIATGFRFGYLKTSHDLEIIDFRGRSTDRNLYRCLTSIQGSEDVTMHSNGCYQRLSSCLGTLQL